MQFDRPNDEIPSALLSGRLQGNSRRRPYPFRELAEGPRVATPARGQAWAFPLDNGGNGITVSSLCA